MTRRTFLALTTALAGTGIGAVAIARQVRTRGLEYYVSRIQWLGFEPVDRLRRHYSWLTVEPATLTRYVKDYQRYFGPLTRWSIPRPDFYTRFLLSTDFFTRPRDVATPPSLAYSGFYFPEQSPCYNPLAQKPPSDSELRQSRIHGTREASELL